MKRQPAVHFVTTLHFVAGVLALSGCARVAVQVGQTQTGGCSTTAQCPVGFFCDENLFACKVSDGYGDPTKVACGRNADCALLYETCDLDAHTCTSAEASGLSTQSQALPAVECLACTSNSDCAAVSPNAGCWLVDADSNGYCGVDCSNGGDCPDGSTCMADTSDTGSTCQPQSASGTCADWTPGQSTSGSGSNGPGSNCASDSDTWSNFAGDFFANNCVSCHQPFSTYAGVVKQATGIQGKLSTGAMPPKPATLDPNDEARILQWLSCGLPQ